MATAPSRRDVLRLLDSVWPHVPPGIERAEAWGGRWFDVSTPYLEYSDGDPVAHVGVVDCELVVDAEPVVVPALHAVCVREDMRGRGWGRRIVERALADLDARGVERVMLWSEKDAFYAKFGFEAVRESVYSIEAPSPETVRARSLDLDRLEDLTRMQEAFASRRPVSDVVAAGDTGWHFSIDLALWTEALGIGTDALLTVMPDDGVVLAAQRVQRSLHIYDVVGDRMPRLARLVGAALARDDDSDAAIDEVQVWFSPDRLDGAFESRPHPEEDFWMIRGAPLFEPGADATLTPFSRT